MVLLCLGLYTVTLNIIPLLMEKGADYTTAAVGLGHVGAGQVGGRLLFGAIPPGARLPVIAGAAACAVLLLAALPGQAPLLIAAGMLAGAVRGCQTLLQATIVGDRWGSQKERLPVPPPPKVKAEPAKTTKNASLAFKPKAPPLQPARLPASPAPRTRMFNYDTTDPRTLNPQFVKKTHTVPASPQLRPVLPPAPLGSTSSALLIARKLAKLREDVRVTSKKPRGSADSVLKARIYELYQTKTTLDPKHHQVVGDELKTANDGPAAFRQHLDVAAPDYETIFLDI